MRRPVLVSTPLFLAASCVFLAPYADASVMNTVIATPSVGNHPEGVAVSPTGANAGDVYVANYSDSTVSVLYGGGPSAASGSDVPVAAQQAYARSQEGTCEKNAPASVNWPGIANQQYTSWGMSWQQWPNNGTGGFVCVRQPFFTTAGSWTAS